MREIDKVNVKMNKKKNSDGKDLRKNQDDEIAKKTTKNKGRKRKINHTKCLTYRQ